MPEPFYDQLYRRAALPAEKPQGWLIASGVYRASLSKEAMSQRLAVEELRAAFRPARLQQRGAGADSAFAATRRSCCPTARCWTAGPSSRSGQRTAAPCWWIFPSPASIGWSLPCGRRCGRRRPVRVSTWRFRGWPRRGWSWRCRRGAGGRGAVRVRAPSARKSKRSRLVAELGPAESLDRPLAGCRRGRRRPRRRSMPRNCSG